MVYLKHAKIFGCCIKSKVDLHLRMAIYIHVLFTDLKKVLMESWWYKRQSADVQSRVSWKLYELVPSSCTCKYPLSVKDGNIKEETTIVIDAVMRGGNHRELSIKLYSVTNGDQVGIDVINRQHSTYLLSMLCITQYVMRFYNF